MPHGPAGGDAEILDDLFADVVAEWRSAEVPPELTRQLRASARVLRLGDGDMLYRRDRVDPSLYALRRGTLIAWTVNDIGEPRPIHALRRGAWPASAATTLGAPRLVDMRASGPATVVAVEGAVVQRLADAEPRLWHWLAQMESRLLAEMVTIVASLLNDGSLQRIAGRLVALVDAGAGDEAVALSQNELALLTGVSRNTAHRTLSLLEQRGLIARGYRRLTILDRAALERLAAEGDPMS